MSTFCKDTEFPNIKQNVYMKNQEILFRGLILQRKQSLKEKIVSFTSTYSRHDVQSQGWWRQLSPKKLSRQLGSFQCHLIHRQMVASDSRQWEGKGGKENVPNVLQYKPRGVPQHFYSHFIPRNLITLPHLNYKE